MNAWFWVGVGVVGALLAALIYLIARFPRW